MSIEQTEIIGDLQRTIVRQRREIADLDERVGAVDRRAFAAETALDRVLSDVESFNDPEARRLCVFCRRTLNGEHHVDCPMVTVHIARALLEG